MIDSLIPFEGLTPQKICKVPLQRSTKKIQKNYKTLTADQLSPSSSISLSIIQNSEGNGQMVPGSPSKKTGSSGGSSGQKSPSSLHKRRTHPRLGSIHYLNFKKSNFLESEFAQLRSQKLLNPNLFSVNNSQCVLYPKEIQALFSDELSVKRVNEVVRNLQTPSTEDFWTSLSSMREVANQQESLVKHLGTKYQDLLKQFEQQSETSQTPAQKSFSNRTTPSNLSNTPNSSQYVEQRDDEMEQLLTTIEKRYQQCSGFPPSSHCEGDPMLLHIVPSQFEKAPSEELEEPVKENQEIISQYSSLKDIQKLPSSASTSWGQAPQVSRKQSEKQEKTLSQNSNSNIQEVETAEIKLSCSSNNSSSSLYHNSDMTLFPPQNNMMVRNSFNGHNNNDENQISGIPPQNDNQSANNFVLDDHVHFSILPYFQDPQDDDFLEARGPKKNQDEFDFSRQQNMIASDKIQDFVELLDINEPNPQQAFQDLLLNTGISKHNKFQRHEAMFDECRQMGFQEYLNF